MYLFFQKGIRVGVSYISKIYDKCNNAHLKLCDRKQASKHILYFDGNNLCGYALCRFSPTDGFKWIVLKEFYSNQYTSDSSKGFALEVDFIFPKELRELLNDNPLAPGKL